MSEPATEWYWDLQKGVAVPADQRGPGDHMLGPYPTKGECENWKAHLQARNDTWDDEDERWNNPDQDSSDEPA